jgi:hypothetical protein
MGSGAYQVESRTSFEPGNLAFIEAMSELDLLRLSTLMLKNKRQVLSRCEALQALNIDMIVGLDLIVIGGVDKRERKHALLLEVGLVDTSEGAGNDSQSTEETWLECGMFAGGALTVVVIAFKRKQSELRCPI